MKISLCNDTKMTFTIKKIREWKVQNKKRELQIICGPERNINLNEVRKVLEKTKTYYLDEYGLSIQKKDVKISKKQATYQWALLEGYFSESGEPIFAWAQKRIDGYFGYAKFGTRYSFDREILKNK